MFMCVCVFVCVCVCVCVCVSVTLPFPRIAGIVVVKPLRHVVDATRLDIVVHSVSTRTGPITCITVPQDCKVSQTSPSLSLLCEGITVLARKQLIGVRSLLVLTRSMMI